MTIRDAESRVANYIWSKHPSASMLTIIVLFMIARNPGASMADLKSMQGKKVCNRTNMIVHWWKDQGMVRAVKVPGYRGGGKKLALHLTPKGLDLLQLDEASQAYGLHEAWNEPNA